MYRFGPQDDAIALADVVYHIAHRLGVSAIRLLSLFASRFDENQSQMAIMLQ